VTPDTFEGEERWQTIGMPSSASRIVLVVVHTLSAEGDDEWETGRIISARRANRRERRTYEEGES
jgi:uncharacterized DUF497 family protein